MKLSTAQTLALRIAEAIRPFCLKVEIAGSIRRQRPECGDIDLVVLPFPTGLDKLQARFKQASQVLKEGPQNAMYQLQNGVQLDVFFAYERTDLITGMSTNWGTLLLCRTGSKEHNIYMVERAKALGLIWRPYAGVFDPMTGDCLASATEEAIFKTLRMDFVPPERREA